MQNIQLYIEGQRIDLFKDESVTITDTIKNVKDVSKVFTEFSRTFNLPASKTNNRIFKHYYNNDIVNGYDARVRVKANIELNFLPFKDGYIKLEGVDLKDNKAHTYRITFFGNTVSLKNIIGDDALTDLAWLENFNKYNDDTPVIYDEETVFDYFTNKKSRTIDGVTYNEPLQIPLLTHTQRLSYDSVEHIDNSSNLDWKGGSGHKNGVAWNELKFSIKVLVIIKAIEKKYNITFSDDFFNNNNYEINKLYMWLHRNKGKITQGGQIEQQTKQVAFPYIIDRASKSLGVVYTVGIPTPFEENGDTYTYHSFSPLRLYTYPVSGDSEIPYDITVYRNGSVYWTATGVTGNIDGQEMQTLLGDYTIEVTSKEAISFSSFHFRLKVRYDVSSGFFNDTFTDYKTEVIISNALEITTEFSYNVLQQLPKMKVLDFLTSLFKMFNLVTYLKNDIIVVQKLEDYYSQGKNYDITKYIDVNNSQSNVALPFREVEYSYKGLKTFFASTHEQLFNKAWGTEEFKNNDTTRYSGGIFKQQIPFEHTKFERLIDIATEDQTDIQWGWCVDDNRESYIGMPLLFYMNYNTLDNSISFVDSVAGDGSFNGHIEATSCFFPQNSNIDLNAPNGNVWKSINFKQEPDEWTGEVNHNSLFNNCHRSYMTSVFEESNRIKKYTAYLPLRILLNYKLNDTFKISEKIYKINSIKTNLQNGKSELELLNNYEQIFSVNYIEYKLPNNSTESILFDWNTFYSASSYNYSIDGVVTNTTNNNASFIIPASENQFVIFVEALDSDGNVLKKSNVLNIQI